MAILITGCSGGAIEDAEDSVAAVRGTALADGSTLDSCLGKAGYDITDAEALAADVDERSFGNGDRFHVVTVGSADHEIRFTVIPERGFVFPYDDASAALLAAAGCAVDGKPLNEKTT
ncbi:hypothetical protein [Knoellia subterranea]|uniref:hypothetical protein n=1 Tax=Knoellia subterranea TaxID=184882 RepID=UPI0012EB86EB|nr:hypothetical protein [Knoellia subterranea]